MAFVVQNMNVTLPKLHAFFQFDCLCGDQGDEF